MSRKQYSDFVTDANGTVISGATVTVYLAGTTTPATIYALSTGTAIAGSVITTGADGSYSFWVDSGDYTYYQTYKIVAVLTGYGTYTKDNIWFGPPPSDLAELGTAQTFTTLQAFSAGINVTTGGSTTISTGVGAVRMSTANGATNTAWIPIKYAGNTYYIPVWTSNAP